MLSDSLKTQTCPGPRSMPYILDPSNVLACNINAMPTQVIHLPGYLKLNCGCYGTIVLYYIGDGSRGAPLCPQPFRAMSCLSILYYSTFMVGFSVLNKYASLVNSEQNPGHVNCGLWRRMGVIKWENGYGQTILHKLKLMTSSISSSAYVLYLSCVLY